MVMQIKLTLASRGGFLFSDFDSYSIKMKIRSLLNLAIVSNATFNCIEMLLRFEDAYDQVDVTFYPPNTFVDLSYNITSRDTVLIDLHIRQPCEEIYREV